MGTLYEELMNVPANNDVIPDTCLSFFEQSLYVADYANYVKMEHIYNVSLQELRHFEESGEWGEYVDENADILMEGVKETSMKILGAIKKVFENMKDSFKAATTKGSALVSQITPEMIKNCSGDFGKTHTFFDYKKIAFAKNGLALAKKVNAAYMKPMDKEEAKKVYDSLSKDFFKNLVGIECKDIPDMKKKLRAELIGNEISVDATFVKKNYNQIKSVVADDTIAKTVESFYVSQVEMMEKIIEDSYQKYKEPAYSNSIGYWEDLMVGIYMVVAGSLGVAVDVYKRMHREYMNILVKVLRNGKKVVKEETEELPQAADPNDPAVKEPEVEATAVVPNADVTVPNDVNNGDPTVGDDVEEASAVSKAITKVGKAQANSAFGQAGLKIGKKIAAARAKKEELKKDEAIKEDDDIDVEDIDDDEPVVELETVSKEYAMVSSAFDF